MSDEPLHNETALLLLIASGDEPAFRSFFDHYAPPIFTFVERLTRSRADAEEIVQDTFMKIWADRENLPGINKPGHYCYIVARNKALDCMRKTARDQRLLNRVWDIISDEKDNSLEEALASQECRRLIDMALQQLSVQQQKVFRLSREEGLSHQEIAGQLGLSRSRVNNILVEVLKHVKLFLARQSDLLAILFWIGTWERFF